MSLDDIFDMSTNNLNVELSLSTDDINIDGLDIDMSWIDEQEKLQNIETKYSKESMKSIEVFFIYINQNKYIDRVISEKYQCDQFSDANMGGSRLSKEIILQIIQSKKRKTPFSKYRFQEALLFHADIEAEDVQAFSKISDNDVINNYNQRFFKALSLMDDVYLPESVFVFHGINSLFFMYQEIPVRGSHKHTLKSILKNRGESGGESGGDGGGGSGNGIRKSKKVHIDNMQNIRKTSKHRE